MTSNSFVNVEPVCCLLVNRRLHLSDVYFVLYLDLTASLERWLNVICLLFKELLITYRSKDIHANKSHKFNFI